MNRIRQQQQLKGQEWWIKLQLTEEQQLDGSSRERERERKDETVELAIK